MSIMGLFTVGRLATLLACFYLYTTFTSLSSMMSPLSTPQAKTFMDGEDWKARAVRPLWNNGDDISATVCVSQRKTIGDDCLKVWGVKEKFGVDGVVEEAGRDEDGNLFKEFIIFGGDEAEQNHKLWEEKKDAKEDDQGFLSNIGSTSFILSGMKLIFGVKDEKKLAPEPLFLPESMWDSIVHKNSTLYIHTSIFNERLGDDHKGANLIASTPLTKEIPPTVVKPKRYLLGDVFDFVDGGESEEEKRRWLVSNERFEKKIDVQHWKPMIMSKVVPDAALYPMEYAGLLAGRMLRTQDGYVVYRPGLSADEMSMTSDKYVELNSTVSYLELKLGFGKISPERDRLITHMEKSLEAQKELGFSQTDLDDVRRLISDTNVVLLGVTVFASTLHLLFELLAFKSEVTFWNENTDLKGLSIRSLFTDAISQIVILLFLKEEGASLLVIAPSVISILIALWKCQKAAGFKLSSGGLRATRLEKDESGKGGEDELTKECDQLAMRSLGRFFLPIVLFSVSRSLIVERHSSWYSWIITSASGTVYTFGFVLMTPQLFLNYKLQSVAHLPWRFLCYKFLNTFIDDLFAFIIRMPTMTRLSCFRDDIVFFIYLYQRFIYDVDSSRPVEGVSQGGHDDRADNNSKTDKKKKE